MKVLVFNCGSSSLKFEILKLARDGRERRQLARGEFEEVGPRAKAVMTDASGKKLRRRPRQKIMRRQPCVHSNGSTQAAVSPGRMWWCIGSCMAVNKSRRLRS